jgi:hypothetical protein
MASMSLSVERDEFAEVSIHNVPEEIIGELSFVKRHDWYEMQIGTIRITLFLKEDKDGKDEKV